LSSLDTLVKVGRFCRGGGAQFRLQDADALLVLAQGGGALVAPGVQLHQLAVRFFVQRIEAQPAPGVVHGGLVLAPGAVSAGQASQGASQFAAQAFGLEELPVIELRAVAQRETGHEVVVIEGGRFGQVGQAIGTALGLGVVVGLDLRQPAAELLDVHPQIVAPHEVDGFPIGLDPGAVQGAVECREGVAQGGPCPGLVEFGPE
jgi:hypothetical protein